MKRFRKLTAWLLTLAMIFTILSGFSLTAQAADATAKITGVVVKVNGTEQPIGVLNITDGDTVEVVYQGENFDNLTNNHKYKIGAYSGSLKSASVEIDTTVIPNTATKTYSASTLNSSTWTTISYTNAGESEIVSGYTINYNNQNDQLEATPKITDVKVLINGTEQPAGEISIADSDTVTIIYSGENFENLGQNNQDYKYRIGTGTGNFYWFTIDTTVTPHTATNVYTGSSVRSGSIGYTNKGEAEVIVYTINYNNQNDQPEVEATPKITDVKVLINGTEQPVGEIFIADSDTVTVIYSGENFENLGQNNQDYKYRIGPYSGNFYSFTIDTTVTPHTATKTYTGSSINYKETIAYTNKDESETVTGYIIKEFTPVTTYSVTIDSSIENGTVIADVSEAAEGDTVTLTVTPADGYEIDTVSYNDGTSDLEVTAVEGVYSFTMPASDVTVLAVFEQLAPITFDGAQIRTQGEQGLRFVFSMDKTYYETLTHPESNTQTGEGFGSILIPEVLLGDERLTKVTENVGIVPAVKLYEVSETTVSFTVCITSVPDYEREYVARAYVTDADGNTLYGECSEAISVFEIAELAYLSEEETAETKQYLLENVLNTVDPEKYPIA